MCGLQIFDRESKKILETLDISAFNFKYKEITLAENERIVGFKSRKYSDDRSARHYDF